MTKLFNKNPLLKIAGIFFLFFIIPMLLSMKLGYQTKAGYLSPLLLLLLTWFLYAKEGKSLAALGLTAKPTNISFFPAGILLGIFFLSLTLFLQMLHNGFAIEVNKNANLLQVAGGVFFLLQGVLNEELIFRGYCLAKTVQQIGFVKANIIFALLFIVWHLISWNAWGHYGMMLGAITTAFGHLLFAVTLYKSGTLYFPIGIHLGINWASRYLFFVPTTNQANAVPGSDVLFLISGGNQNASSLHMVINYAITVACFIAITWLLWQWKNKKFALPAN